MPSYDCKYKYKQLTSDGSIISITQSNNELSNASYTQITTEEYNRLLFFIFQQQVAITEHCLKWESNILVNELYEFQPIDDTDDEATESDYIDALNDLGVEVN